MADPTFILVALFFLFVGVAARTFFAFAQKVYAGKLTWAEFLNRFYGLASAAFIAGTGFYLSIAPLSNDLLQEIILTFILGFFGNTVFNMIYHWVDEYAEKQA